MLVHVLILKPAFLKSILTFFRHEIETSEGAKDVPNTSGAGVVFDPGAARATTGPKEWEGQGSPRDGRSRGRAAGRNPVGRSFRPLRRPAALTTRRHGDQSRAATPPLGTDVANPSPVSQQRVWHL
jgi:hypothetical protein